MDDEILQGYPIARFLGSEKSEGWNPDTRRCYKKALYSLLQFTRSHGAPTPELIGQWQKELQKNYARSAVNVHLAAANNYFRWCGRYDLLRSHTRPVGQKHASPALTRREYLKLLRTACAQGKHRTYLLVKLFTLTGLPIQCLDQLTAELVRQGQGTLQYRGSPLAFDCPAALRQELLDYMQSNGISQGPVFITRTGKLLERPNIFRGFRELCQAAGVPEEKGNPRAMRNLYKATQQEIDDRLAAMKRQMYDQMLEIEQEAIAWRAHAPADWDRTA